MSRDVQRRRDRMQQRFTVAAFARHHMQGSGSSAEEAQAEYQRVINDNAVFTRWDALYLQTLRARPGW